MIKNIIFDVGGTLTRHRRGQSWKDVERSLSDISGVPLERVEAFFRESGHVGGAAGTPLREFWARKTTDVAPLAPAQVETARREFRQELCVPTETFALLKDLKPHCRLFALTNTWKPGHPKRAALIPGYDSPARAEERRTATAEFVAKRNAALGQ